MKIRALIVDDEAPARARLRHSLKNEPDLDIIGECAHGRAAVDIVRRDSPDLMFLDIQMPGLNGFEVCTQLHDAGVRLPFVIFCTAYDQYALKAFEIHAIDYLLKPFSPERLQHALNQARLRLQQAQSASADSRLADLLASLRAGLNPADRLVFKVEGRVILIRAETIDWIEADGNYVRIHCGAEAHYVRETLANLESQLPPDTFMRVSRSALVNLDRIREFQPLFYGDYTVILHTGAKLAMSRTYRERLERLLEKRK
ncbi:MAG TPA: LytTR family DNA-binding domain-containing protein [Verrucomicrobiota bacterium]|nr:LytTR family DNA-binding domain-containing protein [Verrucomicrobiota bacterium]HNU52398.1 LytTR family DNA-binding domain-containing protein [Verrucomicrobiota bacterium]